MRPSRRGPGRAVTRPGPVEHPQATVTKSRGISHDTAETAVRPVSGSPFARFIPSACYWAAAFFAIFGVLAITNHPELTALSAVAAFALATVAEATS